MHALEVALVDRAGKPRRGVSVELVVQRNLSELMVSDESGLARFDVNPDGGISVITADGRMRIVDLRAPPGAVQRIEMVY